MWGFPGLLPRRLPVDLLPFHGLAGDKYGRLGRNWTLAGVADPSPDEITRKADLLRNHGLETTTGGA